MSSRAMEILGPRSPLYLPLYIMYGLSRMVFRIFLR